MKKPVSRKLIAPILLLFASTSSAALIDIGTHSLDVTQGTLIDKVDFFGEPGVYWESQLISINPVLVSEGDTINIGFEFLDGQSLEVLDGSYNKGREIVQFRQVSDSASNGSDTTVSFTGVAGDLIDPGIFSSSGTASFLNGTVGSNMTNTSFYFHDIHFNTEITRLDNGTEELSLIKLTIGASEITTHTAVPEPATLALFGLGFAGIGLARKRKGN